MKINARLLSSRPTIYLIMAVGVLFLALLNFGGWIFLSSLENQLISQLQNQMRTTGDIYARSIEAIADFPDVFYMPHDMFERATLKSVLNGYQNESDLAQIFIVSLDRQLFIDGHPGQSSEDLLKQGFIFSDSLFASAIAGERPLAEKNEFGDQIFLTGYSQIADPGGETIAVLVLEARPELFRSLAFFKQALIYYGAGGLGVLATFATLIILAIRRLFRTEEQLHQHARLAHLGQMAAMVAHEIRNPLSIIKGSADVLRKKYAASGDELFDFIPEEINRLNRLVSDFLQFARSKDLALTEQDPEALLNILVQQMGDTRIERDFQAAGRLIALEPDAFRQVMLNIVENARKATADDGQIMVKTSFSENRPRRYQIVVADNGSGMDEETLAKVFEPFYTTRATGSGLGMAIARQLVEQLNGSISVKSNLTQGTAVTLEFPL